MEIIEIPFGYIKAGKIYRSAWDGYEDYEIGEVRDKDNAKSIQFFRDRFALLEANIKKLIDDIEKSENKGSFLSNLENLGKTLSEHNGLGEYLPLKETLLRYESLVRDTIQKKRLKNFEIKIVLIEEAKQVVNITPWKEAEKKVKELKSQWIKTGNAEKDKNIELNESFKEIIQSYYERRNQFFKDKQKLTEQRVKQYEELVNQTKNLTNLHEKERVEQMKELRGKWRETGSIPNDTYGLLFNKLVTKNKSLTYIQPKEILQKLEQMKEGIIPFERSMLEEFKKSFFTGKSKDKSVCFKLIQLLIEREFVNSTIQKKFPNFSKLEPKKKKAIKLKMIKDLINRDKKDLNLYEENSVLFSLKNKNNNIIDKKINSQKTKIEIKLNILAWIEEDIF